MSVASDGWHEKIGEHDPTQEKLVAPKQEPQRPQQEQGQSGKPIRMRARSGLGAPTKLLPSKRRKARLRIRVTFGGFTLKRWWKDTKGIITGQSIGKPGHGFSRAAQSKGGRRSSSVQKRKQGRFNGL